MRPLHHIAAGLAVLSIAACGAEAANEPGSVRPGSAGSDDTEPVGANPSRVPAGTEVEAVARSLWAAAASGDGATFCGAMTDQAREDEEWAASLFATDCEGQIANLADRSAEEAREDAEALGLDVQQDGDRALVRFSDVTFGQLRLVRQDGQWRLAARQSDGTTSSP